MRHVTAVAVMVLLACLGFAGTGDAQTAQPVQLQGTIQSADCQTGQVTLATASGTDTFQATGQTVAYVNGNTVPLCSLQSYVGDSATVIIVPAGNEFVLSQVNVTAPVQTTPSSGTGIFSSPVAIGIGALLLGGIIGYALGHHSAPAQQPAYYPYGYAPAYLPANYPYGSSYNYQGHRYYRCSNGGWMRDAGCDKEPSEMK